MLITHHEQSVASSRNLSLDVGKFSMKNDPHTLVNCACAHECQGSTAECPWTLCCWCVEEELCVSWGVLELSSRSVLWGCVRWNDAHAFQTPKIRYKFCTFIHDCHSLSSPAHAKNWVQNEALNYFTFHFHFLSQWNFFFPHISMSCRAELSWWARENWWKKVKHSAAVPHFEVVRIALSLLEFKSMFQLLRCHWHRTIMTRDWAA